MLDAAEAVVAKLGISALTLDAVAAEAGASKGGLLHYFRTKDVLIEAMVVRTCDRWRSDTREAIALTPPGPGRAARAVLSMCVGRPQDWTEPMRRSGAVLVAALATNPSLVEPMRRVHQELFNEARDDGLPGGVGEIVLLATNGLWFEWIFGLGEVHPERLAAIRGALVSLLRANGARPDAGEVETTT